MAHVCLAVFLLLASSLTIEARRRPNQGKLRRCEKIAVPECANMGYQRTKFPNPFTNMSSQEETKNYTRFLPVLAQLNCTSTNTMPFLCSVYVPVCQQNRQGVIPPCREFCEEAVGSCPALAASYGIQWPSPLDCSNYPTRNSGNVCIRKLRARRNKKEGKVKPKADETKCCRMGEIAANKNKTCNLTEAIATTLRKRIVKGLSMCIGFQTKFNECCMKRSAKILGRKQKKQNRKNKKLEVKKAKKQQKKAQKKARKEEKQQKRKDKKDERKQKKANRKQKKQNRKQNRKGKKSAKNE